MTEEYRPVPGFESHYQVSDHGNVQSIDRVIVDTNGIQRNMRGRQLSPATHKEDGYRFVNLQIGSDKQRVINIRQLVAAAFLAHPIGGRAHVIVNRNGDPADDRVENLELRTAEGYNADRLERARAARTQKSSCHRGHALSGDNLYLSRGRSNSRRCRSCTLARGHVDRHGLPKDQVDQVADQYYAKFTASEQSAAAA